jgi:hypothetical protein
MEKSEILGILEKLYDTFGENLAFQRDDVAAVMFRILGKSSTISDGRNFNTLIHLKLIKIAPVFPYLKLTNIAVSLLKENNRILNLNAIKEAEQEETQAQIDAQNKAVETEIADYLPDKTALPDVPKSDENV